MSLDDYVIKKTSLTPKLEELGVLLDSLICCRKRYLELIEEVRFDDVESEIEERKRVSRKIRIINSLIKDVENRIDFHYRLISPKFMDKLFV